MVRRMNDMERQFAEFIAAHPDKEKEVICSAFVEHVESTTLLVPRILYDWASLHYNYCRDVTGENPNPNPIVARLAERAGVEEIKKQIFAKAAERLTLRTKMPNGMQFGNWTREIGAKHELTSAAYMVTQTLRQGEKVRNVFTDESLKTFLESQRI